MKTHAQVGSVALTEERCPVTAQFTNIIGMYSALEAHLLDINGNMIGYALTVSNAEGVSDVKYYSYKPVETVPKV
ncbi:TPA: hypothetical protein NNT57_004639 [Salmonella enterica]|nr:hypothetical protein [Salmonella enterica]